MRLPITYPRGQGFGENPSIYASLGMAGHNGWDFPAPRGTVVYAPENGQVTTGFDAKGYGNVVTLQGDSGWQHKLGHLDRFGKTGRVNEGDIVGYVDSTGFSTGNHLHWGTRPPRYNQSNGYYGFVDPAIFLQGGSTNSSMPYSDAQYTEMNRYAINGIFWQVYGQPADEASIKAYLGKGLGEVYQDLFNRQDYQALIDAGTKRVNGKTLPRELIEANRKSHTPVPALVQQYAIDRLSEGSVDQSDSLLTKVKDYIDSLRKK